MRTVRKDMCKKMKHVPYGIFNSSSVIHWVCMLEGLLASHKEFELSGRQWISDHISWVVCWEIGMVRKVGKWVRVYGSFYDRGMVEEESTEHLKGRRSRSWLWILERRSVVLWFWVYFWAYEEELSWHFSEMVKAYSWSLVGDSYTFWSWFGVWDELELGVLHW